MKLLLLIAAFVFVVSATTNTEWEQYKAKYNKVYTSRHEDLTRFNQYMQTKKMIEEHNIRFKKGETTYWKGINQFSDWFAEEINQILGSKDNKSMSEGNQFELPAGKPVPDAINWVKKGAVTKVKNQGHCGSCYAFGSVGALEGLMFRINNTITDLSAQELVDCTDNFGCGGGLEVLCFYYVINRNGIDSDASYPYKAVQQKCRAADGVAVATCNGFIELSSDKNLTEAVGTVGPVTIGFAADKDFMHYKGGIYNGTCATSRNHAMLLVGYDTDKESGTDYWLVKNSWGEEWGEKGYARIVRHENLCFIEDWGMYPTYTPSK